MGQIALIALATNNDSYLIENAMNKLELGGPWFGYHYLIYDVKYLVFMMFYAIVINFEWSLTYGQNENMRKKQT